MLEQPFWRVARVTLPASRAGMSLMSRSGWWIHKDGRIGRKRQQPASSERKRRGRHTS